MDRTTVIIAVVGLITTAGTPITLAWMSARNQEKVNLRDLRIALYTDATFYAENLHAWVERITDELQIWRNPITMRPPDSEAITARLRLLAPKDVLEVWQRMLFNEVRLRWDIQQDFPDLGQDGGRYTIPADLDTAVETEASVQEFYALVGEAFVRQN